jgi:hypothetical protein
MGFQMHGGDNIVYWLTFAVIFGLSIAAAWALYRLGGLPGRIASARGHPQAAAINICGWLGLVVFALWPIALVWAYVTPKAHRHRHRTLSVDNVDDALVEDLRETSEQIAAIKNRLAALSSSKKDADGIRRNPGNHYQTPWAR